ncbi:MAG: hypothetical protein LQ346_002044 [Caloplaca aetnensis]|nr:MAG: hypothetical protein LQ346_002044 [Caloplaca aetnensis]
MPANRGQGLGIKEKAQLDQDNIKKWNAIPTPEHVFPALKADIRADLIEAWHFHRESVFRSELKPSWLFPTDVERIVLNDKRGIIRLEDLRRVCNKPTACYWLQSAQGVLNGIRNDPDQVTFGAMYEEWRACYPENRPNIDYGHFLANPVRITSAGPTTVSEVLEAHRSLCAQTSTLLTQAHAKANERPENIPAWYAQYNHYSLTPLYPAIILIMDRVNDSAKELSTAADGFLRLQRFAQLQTILLVRTGDDEQLSASISFDSLKDQSLPLDRSDATGQEDNIIRVTLATAVKFITNLEEREASAQPDTHYRKLIDPSLCPWAPEGFEGDNQVCYDPETWADANLAMTERDGCDNNFMTWQSIRRILARREGEDFYQFEHTPFRNRWVT